MRNTLILRAVLVGAAAIAAAPEATAQCKGGKQGTGQQASGQTMMQTRQNTLTTQRSTGMGLTTTQSMRRGATSRGPSLQTQSQQPGLGLTTQQVSDDGQTLRTARQLQQQEIALVTTLQGMLDDPNLTEARQKRQKAAITTALQKIQKQDDLLTSLEEQRQSGPLNATQLRQLATLVAYESALVTVLDNYRTAAAQATTIRAMQANQAR
jgi:hypothetical protein